MTKKIIQDISKSIRNHQIVITKLRELQLHFIIKDLFPNELNKHSFFIMNADYYVKNYHFTLRGGVYDIKGAYAKAHKIGERADYLLIYCKEADRLEIYYAPDQKHITKQIAKFK